MRSLYGLLPPHPLSCPEPWDCFQDMWYEHYTIGGHSTLFFNFQRTSVAV